MKTNKRPMRRPYKYPPETFFIARKLKEEGKNNTEIGKILGIPHEKQVRRILLYPLEKITSRTNGA